MAEKPNGHQLEAKLFRALAHPVRLRIMEILLQQEACVCHLSAVLRRAQPYVSQQLATLREAGLVSDRREGTLVYYQPASEHFRALLGEARSVVSELAEERVTFHEVPEEALENCPCPHCREAHTAKP